MSAHHASHLEADEIELWADGLLPAARALHVAACPSCLATAERERQLFVALARLERLAPAAGFRERVLAQVRIPQGAGRAPTG